jgi:hypothetical protein
MPAMTALGVLAVAIPAVWGQFRAIRIAEYTICRQYLSSGGLSTISIVGLLNRLTGI